MSEMIERVAAALAVTDGAGPLEGREYWRVFARAAIEAMREPTAEMMDAAEQHNDGGGFGDSGGIERDSYDLEKVWPAMIDAALDPEVVELNLLLNRSAARR